MITYDSTNLFDSGPASVHLGGIASNQVVHDTLHSRGVCIVHHGTTGRSIKQSGQLMADTPLELQLIIQSIENMIDGRAARLTDEHDCSFDEVLMIAFDPQPMEPLGPRWRCRYRIEYLQVKV